MTTETEGKLLQYGVQIVPLFLGLYSGDAL